jgi:hypothetical protein
MLPTCRTRSRPGCSGVGRPQTRRPRTGRRQECASPRGQPRRRRRRLDPLHDNSAMTSPKWLDQRIKREQQLSDYRGYQRQQLRMICNSPLNLLQLTLVRVTNGVMSPRARGRNSYTGQIFRVHGRAAVVAVLWPRRKPHSEKLRRCVPDVRGSRDRRRNRAVQTGRRGTGSSPPVARGTIHREGPL